MGIFRQMKDMRASAAATPAPVDQASLEPSRGLSVTDRGAAQASPALAWRASPPSAEGPDFEPIAGISLELYVDVTRELAAYNHDQSRAADVAASRGIEKSDWTRAANGWNARMRSNPSVGQRFTALYTAA